MRRSCVWAGIVFHTLPGSSTVMPMDSWQVGSTSGWINWWMTRLLEVSKAPRGFLAASESRMISTAKEDLTYAKPGSALERFQGAELSDHNAVWAMCRLR